MPRERRTPSSDTAAAQAVTQTLDQQPKSTAEEEVREEMRVVMEKLEATRHRTGAVSFGTEAHKAIVLPGAVEASGKTVFVVATEEGFKGLVLPPSNPKGMSPGDEIRFARQAGVTRRLIPRVLEEARTTDGIVPFSKSPEYPPGYYSRVNANRGIDRLTIANRSGCWSFTALDSDIQLVAITDASTVVQAVDASLTMMRRQQPSIDAARTVSRKLRT